MSAEAILMAILGTVVLGATFVVFHEVDRPRSRLQRGGDDGLTRRERARLGREHRDAMMSPLSDAERDALEAATHGPH